MIESVAIIVDQKTNGTSGGTSPGSAWITRDLNTKIFDPDSIVSISSNRFSLAAGVYAIDGWSSTFGSDTVKHGLYNFTDTSYVATGPATYSVDSIPSGRTGHVSAIVSIDDTKEFEYRLYASRSRATSGLGFNCSGLTTDVEYYTTVRIRKLVAGAPDSYAIIRNVQSAGTDGGSAAATTKSTLTLNEITSDPDGIVSSPSANRFTLPAGSYEFFSAQNFFNTNISRTWLYNVDDGTDELLGMNTYARNNTNQSSHCQGLVVGGFTIIAGSKQFEMQYECAAAHATTGLGLAINSVIGNTEECYHTIVLRKI